LRGKAKAKTNAEYAEEKKQRYAEEKRRQR